MMINELQFESVPRVPILSASTGLIAIVMLVVGVSQGNPTLGWASIIPACWAAAGLLSRPRSVRGCVTDNALRIIEPELEVPLDPTTCVNTQKRNPNKPGRPFAIHVAHESGEIEIPDRLNIPSDEVSRAILSRLPASGRGHVMPLLMPYFDQQSKQFGRERVFSTCTYVTGGRKRGSRRGVRAWSLGTIAAGLVYVLAAIVPSPSQRFYWEFLAVSSVILTVGLVVLAYAWMKGQSPLKGVSFYRDSCVVIGPGGLALEQGAVKGTLHWRQLEDVVIRKKPWPIFNEYSTPWRVVLKAERQKITIEDIYDRPLEVIHERIVENWRNKDDVAAVR
jgi:hypothetical protein